MDALTSQRMLSDNIHHILPRFFVFFGIIFNQFLFFFLFFKSLFNALLLFDDDKVEKSSFSELKG